MRSDIPSRRTSVAALARSSVRAACFAFVGCSSPPSASTPAPDLPLPSATTTTPLPDPPVVIAPIAGECDGAKCFDSPSGFRLIHPAKVVHTLESVAALGRGEAIAVGDSAIALRLETSGIKRVVIPDVTSTAQALQAVDPSAKMEQSFPGSRFWMPRFASVVKTGPRQFFVLADRRHIARFDGRAWAMDTVPTGFGGFGGAMFGGEDGVAVLPDPGSAPSSSAIAPIVRAGSAWKKGGELPPKTLPRSGALRGDTTWIGANDGQVLRSRAGAAFEIEALTPPVKDDVINVWISRDGEHGFAQTRWGKLYARSAGAWNEVEEIAGEDGVKSGRIESFWESPSGVTWAVGAQIHRRQKGDRWRSVPLPDWAPKKEGRSDLFEGERFHAIDGTSDDDVWIVGRNGAVLHWNGAEIREITPRHTETAIVALLPLEGEKWLTVADDGTVLRGEKDRVDVEIRIEGGVASATRANDGAIVVVDRQGSIHVRGTDGWRRSPGFKGFSSAVGAASASDLFDLGWDGRMDRATKDSVWAIPTHVKSELRAMAFDGDEIWVVGDGVILRGKGRRFSIAAKHPHDDYRAISVRGPNDIWIAGDSRAVGEGGLVLHWNGKKFERHESLNANGFNAIHARGSTVWAVGGGGAASWFDGARWTTATTSTGKLNAVWISPGGDVVAAGAGGAIVRLPFAPP